MGILLLSLFFISFGNRTFAALLSVQWVQEHRVGHLTCRNRDGTRQAIYSSCNGQQRKWQNTENSPATGNQAKMALTYKVDYKKAKNTFILLPLVWRG